MQGAKPGPSYSNKWLKSENKASSSKKATEIGSLALSQSDSTLCNETYDIALFLAVEYSKTKIAKENIKFVCASLKPVAMLAETGNCVSLFRCCAARQIPFESQYFISRNTISSVTQALQKQKKLPLPINLSQYTVYGQL